MSDEDSEFDAGEIQCSYCGKWIYGDSPRCPKCGEYTDGQGAYQRPAKDGRRIPLVWVIAGWIVIFAILAPVVVMVVNYYLQHKPK